VVCSLARCILERVDGWLYLAFDDFVKRHYSQYAFEHVARIDVPTFMDPSVSQRLDAVSLRYGYCTVGRTLDSLLRSGCSIIVLFTQVSVLVTILQEQGMGSTLGFLTCLCHLIVCTLTQVELSNSSLDGLGPSVQHQGLALIFLFFFSICGHNQKPRFCQDGSSQTTCQRS